MLFAETLVRPQRRVPQTASRQGQGQERRQEREQECMGNVRHESETADKNMRTHTMTDEAYHRDSSNGNIYICAINSRVFHVCTHFYPKYIPNAL